MVTYAPHTSTDALRRARGWVGKYYHPGWCQAWVVADIFGTGGVGDWDGDSAADAEDGWKKAVARGKVVTAAQIGRYTDIPAGVACYWTGGSNDNGHAAVSAGSGYIFSTDLPNRGYIGKVPLGDVHTRWGLTFLGYVLIEGNGYTLTDPPAVTADTVFDFSWWSMAAARYFGKAWLPRVPGIGIQIRDEASTQGFTELYDNSTALDILGELNKNGANFKRSHRDPALQNGGPAGLEFMYDNDKWAVERPAKAYASGIQNRHAFVSHLTRRQTGQHVALVIAHGPVFYDSLKQQYGAWLVRLLSQIDGPILLGGDVNISNPAKSPRSNLAAAGFRTLEQQAVVPNEDAEEFPSKGDLADIWSKPADLQLRPGLLDLTPPDLSDHRRLESRCVVPA